MGTGGGLVVIDFSDQGNSAHFRRDGWSGQEPDRVWGIGSRSVLVVPIQSSGRPVMLEAEIAPAAPVPIVTGQIVRLQVNGVAIGSVRIDQRTMIRCEIDPAIAGHAGNLEIEFGFPGFYRLDHLGLSGDDRPLSCWFSFVRVYTTDMYKPGPWFPASHPNIPVVNLLPPFADVTAAQTAMTRTIHTFGRNGTVSPHLRDGWDVGDDDDSSTFVSVARLDLPGPPEPGAYDLRLELRTPECHAAPVPAWVTVLLDHVVLGQIRVVGPTTGVLALPRELTERRDTLSLTLRLPVIKNLAETDSVDMPPPAIVALSLIAIFPASSMVSAADPPETPMVPDLEESPRNVARWVRGLHLRAPRNLRDVFLLLGCLRHGDPFNSLLEQINFAGVDPAELFQVVMGRAPSSEDFAADPRDADPGQTFRRAVMSLEFRNWSPFRFLEAFPELARDIFIHVPKCAGTDLIINLGQRRQRMPLPYMLRFPEWIPDDEFLSVLNGLVRNVPFHDRIFIYGHMNLGEFPTGFRIRPDDRIFSIIRDPLTLMVSQANYAVGRLLQDPKGNDPDTSEFLSALGIPRLPDGLSDLEFKDLVVRALFNPGIAFKNNACRHLGSVTGWEFEDAMANIVENDIEITTTGYYEQWLRERWGISGSERHNRSDAILTEREARRLYSDVLRDSVLQDLKLFNLVTWAIEKAGATSITGRRLLCLTEPESPVSLANELTRTSWPGPDGGAPDLFVVQDDHSIARYLQAPSVVIPGARRPEEILSLRFGINDAGVTFLSTGWADAENSFTWTNGTESTILLPPFEYEGDCVIRIAGWPFIVRGSLPSQNIVIFLNEICIGSCTVSDICLMEFDIPRSAAARSTQFELKLIVPGARRPNEVIESPDNRMLGFCLEKVVVINYISQRADQPDQSPTPIREKDQVYQE